MLKGSALECGDLSPEHHSQAGSGGMHWRAGGWKRSQVLIYFLHLDWVTSKCSSCFLQKQNNLSPDSSPNFHQPGRLISFYPCGQWEQGTRWGDLDSSCQNQMLGNHQPFYGILWAELGPEHCVQRWVPEQGLLRINGTPTRYHHVGANPLCGLRKEPHCPLQPLSPG